MKTITTAMSNLLASEGIQALATFWLVKRKDGTVLAFTDWPENVTAISYTFQSASGISRSAIEQRADLAAPNMNVTGIVTTGFITDEDIRNGLYNSATVQVWMAVPGDANFATYGRIPLPGAYIGEIKIQDGVYVLELRGWSYQLQQSYVELFTPTCCADFCDSRCKLTAANYTMTGTVAAVQSALTSFYVTPGTFGADCNINSNWTFGVLTFTGGVNTNYKVEVAASSVVSGGTYNGDLSVSLYLGTPKTISVGDTVSILCGCNKTINTCLSYNNVVNFRGTPFIPGMNFLYDYGIVAP